MQSVKLKTAIRQLGEGELKDWITSIGEPSFRAGQIYKWLWQKGVQGFEEMTNLSFELRELLSQNFDLQALILDTQQDSVDGTIKMRYKLHDGFKIETVLIPVPVDKRYTVCVSTQVGCSLTCSFCATGKMKRERNLEPFEIYDQVLNTNKLCLERYGAPLTNVVYMGMGEPLLNYRHTLKSIEHICSAKGLGMSPKRITVSTAGIDKMIRKLADDEVKFNLALSLHAADDEKRDKIMPINGQNNLQSLLESLEYFYKKTKGRISYEYIAFKNFNDSLVDAKRLVKLCRRFPVRVNIIEYNSIDGFDMDKASEQNIDLFAQYLRSENVMATVRRSRGKDIDAACGQLANKN